MFRRRGILYLLVLLPRLMAQSAEASDALEHYNARLDAIARSYKQEFAEIRKNQRRIGAEKADFRAAEQKIKELGMMRTAAVAEAKLIYEKEQKEQKQTDAGPPARLSREQRQRESLAARRELFDEGQKGFWNRVAREEPRIAELWAARRQAIEERQSAFWAGLPLREAQYVELLASRRQALEEEQTAFWAELFEPPKTIPRDRTRIAATRPMQSASN
jgi:hypothetical protein